MWTHGAAKRHTIVPINNAMPSSRRPGELLLISRPADRRRLSLPEHAIGQLLAQGCLQWTGCESNPQPLGYEYTHRPPAHIEADRQEERQTEVGLYRSLHEDRTYSRHDTIRNNCTKPNGKPK